MSKVFWQLLKGAPAAIATSVCLANASVATELSAFPLAAEPIEPALELASPLAQALPSAEAEVSSASALLEQISQYNAQGDALDQVTNVNQFRDVAPTDWAFEALRSLVERYACIVGYPDRTFRGNRALTRYEFAAGLNACLQQIERLIAAGQAPGDGVTQADLQTLQRLVQEFEAELATLGTRVDNLEARTGFLEQNQFSTTTRLSGEVIFTLVDAFGDNIPNTNEPLDINTAFGQRVRLNLDSSFTGRDRLRIRLQGGNMPRLDQAIGTNVGRGVGTDMIRFGHDTNTDNDVEVARVHYQFPIGDAIRFHVALRDFGEDNVLDPNNPVFASGGAGALSRFGRRNPAIYRTIGADQVVGANIRLTNNIGLDLGYFTDRGNDPTRGFFGGNYSAEAQLNFDIGPTFRLGVAYGRTFLTDSVNLSGSTGSLNARNPFGRTLPGFRTSEIDADRYGVQANWRLTPTINLGGWVGLVEARARDRDATASIWNWAANLAFLDFGGRGNVLGFIVGMPPKLTESFGLPDPTNPAASLADPGTSLLVEAQYRFRLTDRILLTPGVYAIFNPDHNDNNDTIYVGLLRTTFTF